MENVKVLLRRIKRLSKGEKGLCIFLITILIPLIAFVICLLKELSGLTIATSFIRMHLSNTGKYAKEKYSETIEALKEKEANEGKA